MVYSSVDESIRIESSGPSNHYLGLHLDLGSLLQSRVPSLPSCLPAADRSSASKNCKFASKSNKKKSQKDIRGKRNKERDKRDDEESKKAARLAATAAAVCAGLVVGV